METADVKQIVFVIIFIILFLSLFIYTIWLHTKPIYLFIGVNISIYFLRFVLYLFRLYIVIFRWNKEYLLQNIKLCLKLNYYDAVLVEWIQRLYIFLYVKTPKEKHTEEMKRRYEMAIRAVDIQREHGYVFKAERRLRNEDGSYKYDEKGEYELMSNDDALRAAADKEFTVVWFRGRTARQYAEDRDRMIEVTNRRGEVVQKISTGSLDLNMLLGSITRVERFLPPEGICERCGIDHSSAGHVDKNGYLDIEKLMKFDVNKSKDGPLKKEIVIDHFDDAKRQELVSFMRDMGAGEEKLGEE